MPAMRRPAQTTFNTRHLSFKMQTEKSITNTGEEKRMALASPTEKSIRKMIS
jgi:hypothetical protein